MGYTTASKVQEELKLSTAFDSTTLPSLSTVTSWIEEESSYIDSISGKKFSETEYTQTIDYDGSDRIQLKYAPVISVTSLLYSTSELGSSTYALADTKVEDTDYTLYKETGEIGILWQNWSPKVGDKRMQIIYTAGYTSDDLPLFIQKLATKMVAKRSIDSALSNDIQQRKSGKSISVGSISIVKPSDYGVSGYKNITDDIDSLKNELLKDGGVYRYTNY